VPFSPQAGSTQASATFTIPASYTGGPSRPGLIRRCGQSPATATCSLPTRPGSARSASPWPPR